MTKPNKSNFLYPPESSTLTGWIFVCVICCSLFSTSCRNPFATREPEEPSQSQSTFYQPISAEIVFDNLIAAIREKNVDNYVRCFGSSEAQRSGFRFLPETSVDNNYQGRFEMWGIFQEKSSANTLFAHIPPDSVSSLLINTVTKTEFADSIFTTLEYDLLVAHTRSTVPTLLAGRMDIALSKGEDALWYISFWADYKTSDLPVWSLIKAEF